MQMSTLQKRRLSRNTTSRKRLPGSSVPWCQSQASDNGSKMASANNKARPQRSHTLDVRFKGTRKKTVPSPRFSISYLIYRGKILEHAQNRELGKSKIPLEPSPKGGRPPVQNDPRPLRVPKYCAEHICWQRRTALCALALSRSSCWRRPWKNTETYQFAVRGRKPEITK